MPAITGERTGTIAASILGAVIVLTAIATTLPFGISMIGSLSWSAATLIRGN